VLLTSENSSDKEDAEVRKDAGVAHKRKRGGTRGRGGNGLRLSLAVPGRQSYFTGLPAVILDTGH